jgi:hypothetical protein
LFSSLLPNIFLISFFPLCIFMLFIVFLSFSLSLKPQTSYAFFFFSTFWNPFGFLLYFDDWAAHFHKINLKLLSFFLSFFRLKFESFFLFFIF